MFKFTITNNAGTRVVGPADTREEVNDYVKKWDREARGCAGILADDAPMNGLIIDFDAEVIGTWRLEELPDVTGSPESDSEIPGEDTW
ncbi:hypothetical protein PP301_gp086 [Gordonia phage GMA2]|uniref:Uncharacterized protein n=1 Tax=Gordonia phage GMA2 TaxID=1647283 RepID=A0A0K0N7J0_9CAUD|nr:hypothetical protein PP301_gp086 [Gordonia phage GMA2]AKJ72636.1 hypothetical protein GMA2_98 [Gordonia phage GMA2]